MAPLPKGWLQAGHAAAQVKVARLLSQGEALPQAAMGWNAVALNVLPVFNPTMGYVNYVVPAVFVLILHQVLLMGTGILGRPRTSAAAGRVRLLANAPRAGLCCWPAPWWWGLFRPSGDLLLRLLLRSLRYRPHR